MFLHISEGERFARPCIARTICFFFLFFTIVLRTQSNTPGRGAPAAVRPPWRPSVSALSALTRSLPSGLPYGVDYLLLEYCVRVRQCSDCVSLFGLTRDALLSSRLSLTIPYSQHTWLVYLPTYLPTTHTCTYLLAYFHTHLSTHLPAYLPTCLPTYVPACLG